MNLNAKIGIGLFLALMGCALIGAAQTSPQPERSGEHTGPPTAKEIIRALLSSGDVNLTVDPSCQGVGSTFNDTTMGDYISGLLAEYTHTTGKNWLAVSVKPAASTLNKETVWDCEVSFERVDGEERLGWGVRFSMRAADRSVIKDSWRCIGGG